MQHARRQITLSRNGVRGNRTALSQAGSQQARHFKVEPDAVSFRGRPQFAPNRKRQEAGCKLFIAQALESEVFEVDAARRSNKSFPMRVEQGHAAPEKQRAVIGLTGASLYEE